jgi:hypothetical protein
MKKFWWSVVFKVGCMRTPLYIYRLLKLPKQIKSLLLNEYNPTTSWVNKNTELVMDGFPGSGNSFSANVIKYYQPGNLRTANHLHSPLLIIRAIELGLPVVVFIREPLAAVISANRRMPWSDKMQSLKIYPQFYRMLMPYAGKFVVSDFERTITDLNSVIIELNEQFDCKFCEIPTNEELAGFKPTKATKEKKQIIEELKQELLEKNGVDACLREAQHVYEEFIKLTRL